MMRTRLIRRILSMLLLAAALTASAAYDLKNQPTAVLDGWKMEAETDRSDGIYTASDTIVFRVRLLKDGQPAAGRKLLYSFRGDHFSAGRGELVSGDDWLEVKVRPRGAGFTLIKVDCPLDGGRKIYARAGAMTDPETIRPGLPAPEDFDAFWQRQREAVTAAMAPARETPVAVDPEYADRLEVLDVQIPMADGKPVSAYLTRPKRVPGRKLPAMIAWHAAGVRSAIKQYGFAELGLLVLDVNAHGLPNGGDPAEYISLYRGPMKNYRFENASDRDNIYFNGMFRRLIRAIEYIKRHPDWDGRTLIVYGGSQGGAQALVSAGLEPKVSAVIAHEPAMCDHSALFAGRDAGWPRFIQFKNRRPVDPAVAEAVRYYDAATFAARINPAAEVLVITGFIDTVCVPSSVFAAYNAIPAAKKRIVCFPQAIHGSYPEFDRVTLDFLRRLLSEKSAEAK